MPCATGLSDIMEDWVLDNMDRAAQVPELESLIADIKSATESPYATDEIKVKRVRALIEDYGY